MEHPIKMDDLGVPLFLETPIYMLKLLVLDIHWLSNSSSYTDQNQTDALNPDDFHHVQRDWRVQLRTKHTAIILLLSWWFQPLWKILVKLDHFPK